MKKVRVLIIGMLIFFIKIHLIAQDTITINFDAEYHIVDEKGYGFMKLIDNHSNEIKYDGNTYRVTFPNQFFVTDTAIAFNYFTGWDNPSIENATAFLFGNYTSRSPVVYVDYNHNLDFSDDGQLLKFNTDSILTVYLSNSKIPSAFFPIKFFYPRLKPKQKEQVKAIFANMGPDTEGNSIVGIDYWLADKRKNYKVADSWLNGKPIKVGLYDYDCNGLFNDLNEDRILIGNFEENLISGKLEKGAIEFSEKVQVQIAGEIYEVVEIEPTGRYLKLVNSNKAYHKPLGVGDNISDVEIELITGDTTTISELLKEKKFLLLDFWGTWCRGCTQQLPCLKKLVNDSDEIQVVGLNYGDDLSKIEDYLSKYDIQWKNGIATEEIMKKLSIDGFPNYLLIDEMGNILIMNGTIEEIEKKL